MLVLNFFHFYSTCSSVTAGNSSYHTASIIMKTIS